MFRESHRLIFISVFSSKQAMAYPKSCHNINFLRLSLLKPQVLKYTLGADDKSLERIRPNSFATSFNKKKGKVMSDFDYTIYDQLVLELIEN